MCIRDRQEIADKEAAAKFIEAVGQFERIMNDSGFAIVFAEQVGTLARRSVLVSYRDPDVRIGLHVADRIGHVFALGGH